MITSKIYRYYGWAIAGLSGSVLLGQIMQYPALRLGAIALWLCMFTACLVVGLGIFAALRKNVDATGGQYFDWLQWPIGIAFLLVCGLFLGILAG